MIDIWEGMVVCHRKALSHISHNQCLELSESPSDCGSCGNSQHVIKIRSEDERRAKERKQECKKLASRRTS